jgi:thioredoxin reductase (NADPH)
VFTIHAERQFTGEIDLFNDREILVGGRMGHDGRVVRMKRAQFQRLLAAEPDIAETIMRAFILRRIGLIEHAQGAATLIGSRDVGTGDALRLQRFLRRNAYPVRVLDIDADPRRPRSLRPRASRQRTCLWCSAGEGRCWRRPSNLEMAAALGMLEVLPVDTGVRRRCRRWRALPGLATAVYAASEGLATIGARAGGSRRQAGTSSKIENYLGLSDRHLGPGARGTRAGSGAEVRRSHRRATDGAQPRLQLPSLWPGARRRLPRHCPCVVIATGARYRRLENVPGIERFDNGNGIHYAATAMEAGLCSGEEVVVVGGGNSAGQAAIFLSRHAAHVHILVRGPNLAASMSDYLVSRIAASDRITLHTHSEIAALEGGRHLAHVTWRNRENGTEETRPVANVFLMLGAIPNTEWLSGCGVGVDKGGFILVGAAAGVVADNPSWRGREPSLFETSQPGIFAVGDVRAGSVKRVASSVGEGSAVVSAVHQVLAEG